jgi:hypothetical protein
MATGFLRSLIVFVFFTWLTFFVSIFPLRASAQNSTLVKAETSDAWHLIEVLIDRSDRFELHLNPISAAQGDGTTFSFSRPKFEKGEKIVSAHWDKVFYQYLEVTTLSPSGKLRSYTISRDKTKAGKGVPYIEVPSLSQGRLLSVRDTRGISLEAFVLTPQSEVIRYLIPPTSAEGARVLAFPFMSLKMREDEKVFFAEGNRFGLRVYTVDRYGRVFLRESFPDNGLSNNVKIIQVATVPVPKGKPGTEILLGQVESSKLTFFEPEGDGVMTVHTADLSNNNKSFKTLYRCARKLREARTR